MLVKPYQIVIGLICAIIGIIIGIVLYTQFISTF